VCTIGQHCWETVVDEGCVESAPASYYRDWTCDGPEDCANGPCCVTPIPISDGYRFRIGCAEGACPGGSGEMCNVDSDCPGEMHCCATRVRSTAGVCRATCAG
jgi:hypothetical protein